MHMQPYRLLRLLRDAEDTLLNPSAQDPQSAQEPSTTWCKESTGFNLGAHAREDACSPSSGT
jgi:hypothetical protein